MQFTQEQKLRIETLIEKRVLRERQSFDGERSALNNELVALRAETASIIAANNTARCDELAMRRMQVTRLESERGVLAGLLNRWLVPRRTNGGLP